MEKIALETDIYNVGLVGSPWANRCCTKKRSTELGCDTTRTALREDNQLITEASAYSTWAYSYRVDGATDFYELEVPNYSMFYLEAYTNQGYTIAIAIDLTSLKSTTSINGENTLYFTGDSDYSYFVEDKIKFRCYTTGINVGEIQIIYGSNSFTIRQDTTQVYENTFEEASQAEIINIQIGSY